MNLLVVDDEVIQLMSLKRGLKNLGHEVIPFTRAEAAIDFLMDGSKKIDILLTDYSMPGMNGMELIKKVRSTDKTLPIIIMTAYGEKELILEALRHRCDGYLNKPFSLENLEQEIERVEKNNER